MTFWRLIILGCNSDGETLKSFILSPIFHWQLIGWVSPELPPEDWRTSQCLLMGLAIPEDNWGPFERHLAGLKSSLDIPNQDEEFMALGIWFVVQFLPILANRIIGHWSNYSLINLWRATNPQCLLYREQIWHFSWPRKDFDLSKGRTKSCDPTVTEQISSDSERKELK